MAILRQYPGFEVTIEVKDNPLPEYDFVKLHAERDAPTDAAVTEVDAMSSSSTNTAPATEARSITKYIQIPLSTEFTVRYKCNPNFGYASDRIYMEPSLDGKIVLIPDVRYTISRGSHSHVCYGGEVWQDDAMRSHRFKLTELNMVEEQVTDEMRRRMRDHGEIKLDFFFTEVGQTIAATELPQLEFDDNNRSISTKAVKETLASDGYVPTQSAGLAPAVEKIGGHLEEVKVIDKLGTFIFKYRTAETLKDLGIIPRTPPLTPPRSPTPLLERDETSMNEQELRQLLAQIKRQEQDRIRVKREQQDSNDTEADNNELQWLGTQPCKKKLRAMPTANDEVVSVDD